MPDLGYLEGTSQPAAGWQGLARPYFHPQRLFAPPSPPLFMSRSCFTRHGGESVFGLFRGHSEGTQNRTFDAHVEH